MRCLTTLGLAAAALLPCAAAANDLPFFGEATFGITAAAQFFDARSHQHPYPAKYDEHAHTAEGFALDEFFVAAANEETRAFLSVRAQDAGQRDQRLQADAGVFGRWRAEASFAAIPTLYTHITRTPFAHLGNGRLVVDEAIRRDLEEASDDEVIARARRVATMSAATDVAFRRNILAGRALWRPNEWLELRVAASEQARNGSKPFSIGSFDVGASGVSILLFEFAEPVETRTNEVSGGVTLRGREWNVDVDASAARFRNTIAFIDYDNPFRITHAAAVDGGLAGRMRASRGHATSAPNTTSRALRASGAFAIGERAHAGLSLAWTGMTQDQRFVPWTLNLAIPGSGLPDGLGPTNGEALPRPSLQGEASVLSTDDSLALTLTRDVTMTLRYRDYDFRSRTPDLFMPGYAGHGDASWRTELDGRAIVAAGHSFRRQSGQTDLVWDHKPFRVRVAHEREIWTREHRQSGRSEQDSLSAAVQVRSKRWHSRATARYRRRDGMATTSNGVPGFDMDDRQRAEASAFAVWTPSDGFSVTGGFVGHQSDYGARAGLQELAAYDANVAVRAVWDDKFEATARVSRDAMSYQYVHDGVWGREVSDGSIAAGIDVMKIAGRFIINAGWEHAAGRQKIAVMNGGRVEEWPRVRTSWQRLESEVELELTPRWRTGVRYRYSPFSLDDYATNELSVYPFDQISSATDARRVLLLDTRYDGYEVHVLAIYFRLTSQ